MLINTKAIDSFQFEVFNKRYPYPWIDFPDFLTKEGFDELHDNFPPIDLFEYHQGLDRVVGQRSHDRYYLAYERSVYKDRILDKDSKGVAKLEDLPPAWKNFIDELEHNSTYLSFIQKALGVDPLKMRFAWHMGKTSNEVSPHFDDLYKIGTHIFYFNSSGDWDPSWGGQLLVLGGILKNVKNPEFYDFTTMQAVSNVDNHSFLFKNSSIAWHGVKALKCPEGKFRKLFNVIFTQ